MDVFIDRDVESDGHGQILYSIQDHTSSGAVVQERPSVRPAPQGNESRRGLSRWLSFRDPEALLVAAE